MELNTRGWATPPKEVIEKYLNLCSQLVADDALFANFRSNPEFQIIFEGGDASVIQTALKGIKKIDKWDVFLKDFELLSHNDIVGNPVLHQVEGVGGIAASTVRYANVAYDIQSIAPKKLDVVVEIGGAYGGLCRVMDSLYDIQEYYLVDQPEVLALAKKYLSHFDIKATVHYVLPEEVKALEKVDLFVADASLAECNAETQNLYLRTYAAKATYCFIGYNTLHIPESFQLFLHLIFRFNGKKVMLTHPAHPTENSYFTAVANIKIW